MEAALIISVNILFFALFAWFLNRHFNNIDKRFEELRTYIDKQFEELKADNREIRSQIYNHIPSQIRQIQDHAREQDKKIDDLQRDVHGINKKLDIILEKVT